MKWVCKLVLVLFTLSLFQGWFLFHPAELDSATLTDAKSLTSNSRLSFKMDLDGDHSAGATYITVKAAADADQNTNHVFPGDSVTIGSTTARTVATVVDTTHFTIDTGLSTGASNNDDVYINQTATHTVTFTTSTTIPDGAIRVSIPANANDSTNSDSVPDTDGFDLGTVDTTGPSDDVSCPDKTTFDFATDAHTATDAGTSGWHTFECRYSGNGTSSTALTMTIASTNNFINPAPESGHTQGTADDYTIRIQLLNANDQVIDNVDAKEVYVEAVRVTATVEETLSFTIALVGSGTTNCGANASSDVTTTIYSVPFGSIITANSFYDAEQQLTVSTNADDGYEVTVFEDDELGLDGADSPAIPDTPCDTACTHTTAQEWVTTSTNGFGYSLQNSSGSDAKFEWDDNTPTTGFKAKQFPNRSVLSTEDQDTDAEIMSNAGPVSGSSIYVCYRLDVSGTQEAGQYYNNVTYIATPQF